MTASKATTLAFYRQSQNFEDLQFQRPKSLDTVRKAILQQVDDIENRLQLLQADFYDRVCSHEDYIQSILPNVHHVMDCNDITYIHAAYQIEELQYKSKYILSTETDNETNVILTDIKCDEEILLKYHKKLLDYMPAFFEPLIDDIKKVIPVLNKYLKSYSKNKSLQKTYLETAYHYEMKRKEIENTLNMHMRNITTMSKGYRLRTGLNVHMFGFTVNQIARKCNVGDLPILLVFPQACQNIQQCCEGINTWVKADEDYSMFLKMDILTLKESKQAKASEIKNTKENIYHIEHGIKNTLREIQDIEFELEKLKPREIKINLEVESLCKSIESIKLDIEIKEQQRDTLKANGSDLKAVSKIANAISNLRYQIPQTDHKIEALKDKAGIITKRKVMVDQKKEYVVTCRTELNDLKCQLNSQEKEIADIDKGIAELKEMYIGKTSLDVTKKIFHDLPVEPRNLKLNNVREDRIKSSKIQINRDPLSIAIQITAKLINGDWSKLYRSLHFYPIRGQQNIDEDIANIVDIHSRNTDKVKAKKSFERWRRLHSRANVKDLTKALDTINRHDITIAINSTLHPETKSIEKKTTVKQRWQRVKCLQMAVGRFKISKINTNNASRGPGLKKIGVNLLGKHKCAQKRENKVHFSLPKITTK